MIIYNYLFYHTYILALRSRTNRDMPIFVPVMYVSICFILNAFTVLLFLEGFDVNTTRFVRREYSFFWAIIVVALIFLYYLKGNKYQSILKKYETKRRTETVKSILIVVSYFIVTISFVFLAGFFKNHDWIFKNLNY